MLNLAKHEIHPGYKCKKANNKYSKMRITLILIISILICIELSCSVKLSMEKGLMIQVPGQCDHTRYLHNPM